MMRLILVFSFCFCSILGQAQPDSFEMHPTDSLIKTVSYNIAKVHTLFLKNVTSESLALGWRLVEQEYPEDWFIELCDNGICYGDIPNSGDFLEFNEDDAFLKFTINPYEIDGTARFTFRLFEKGFPDNYAIMHFQFTADGTVNVSKEEKSELITFPNPADQIIHLDNINLNNSIIEIFNFEGKRIKSYYSNSLDVSDLQQGNYILKITSPDKISTKRIQIY